MKVRMKNPGIIRGACLTCCLVVLTDGGWAATPPIYKCLDKNLGLLYTDEPCKEGEQLNIRPGDADPAAVARLERQRDALDQSASQRIADLRRAATEGEHASRLRYEQWLQLAVRASALMRGAARRPSSFPQCFVAEDCAS